MTADRIAQVIADAESAQDDLNAFTYDTDVRGPGRVYGKRYGWSAENDAILDRYFRIPLEDRADRTAANAYYATHQTVAR